MRENIFGTYGKHFEYKRGYLNCHDWRPREFNQQADAVCNWVLDDDEDIDELDLHQVASRLTRYKALQIFSGGGLDGSRGVAAFVVVGSTWENCTWRIEIFGFRGILIRDAVSAFQAEIIAADAAIAFAKDLGIACSHFCAA